MFRGADCKHKVEQAHADIIRGLSVGSTHVLSAANDCVLKMWSFEGCEMKTMAGHGSFVYGVAHSNDGTNFFSSSDDCTMKVWTTEDFSVKKSVVHAGTVWQTCPMQNGDVVGAHAI